MIRSTDEGAISVDLGEVTGVELDEPAEQLVLPPVIYDLPAAGEIGDADQLSSRHRSARNFNV